MLNKGHTPRSPLAANDRNLKNLKGSGLHRDDWLMLTREVTISIYSDEQSLLLKRGRGLNEEFYITR